MSDPESLKKPLLNSGTNTSMQSSGQSPVFEKKIISRKETVEAVFERRPKHQNTDDPLDVAYDPFHIPADLDKAEEHAHAKRVARPNTQNLLLCPCCNMFIDNSPVKICCDPKEFCFIGCAYPYYFYFMKLVLLVVFLMFLVGGSFNLLLINYNCRDNCVKFFGLGILNYDKVGTKIYGQSWIDTIITFVIFGLMLQIKPKLFERMKAYNDEALSISSYTIMIQNLPKKTTREEIINYFFNLTNKQDIVKVNMAYKVDDYINLFNEKISICSKLQESKNRLEDLYSMDTDNMSEAKKQKINLKRLNHSQIVSSLQSRKDEIDTIMNKFEIDCQDEKSDHFSGTAFLTFTSQLPVKAILNTYGVKYWRTIKFLLFGRCCRSYLRFKGTTIIIHRAPDPTDLIWENLEFSFWGTFRNYIIMYFVSGGVLVFSFYIQCLVIKFVYKHKEEVAHNTATNDVTIKLTSLIYSSFIIITNFLLRITVYYFTYLQKFYSYTKFNQSYINVYVLLYFFNSAFMPYIVNSNSKKTTSEQLVWDIHLILLSNAFATPLYKVFDPFAHFRSLMRFYIRKMGKRCTMTQHEVNSWFEGPPIDIAENYAFTVRILFITTWYAGVAPIGLIFCMIGLGFNYWLDKVLLLRVQSFPQSQNEDIIKVIVDNMEILAYFYLLGVMEYNSRLVVSENLMDFLYQFLAYGVSSITFSFAYLVYFIFYKHRGTTKNYSEKTYEEVKLDFVTEYDRINPMTAQKANKEWIEFMRSQMKNLDEEEKEALAIRFRTSVRAGQGNMQSFVAGMRSSYAGRIDKLENHLPEKVNSLPEYLISRKESVDIEMTNISPTTGVRIIKKEDSAHSD